MLTCNSPINSAVILKINVKIAYMTCLSTNFDTLDIVINIIHSMYRKVVHLCSVLNFKVNFLRMISLHFGKVYVHFKIGSTYIPRYMYPVLN